MKPTISKKVNINNLLISWVFLGVAYTGLEDDQEAEEAYKRAIEINPDTMLAWHGLVNFYEKRNKQTELAKTIQDILPRVVAR
ncbi:hypothetical protein G6F68_021436 [Rhizopus microsporus]|nr:hypothetical protein G6F68_021436 [Rhizopus microsporus]